MQHGLCKHQRAPQEATFKEDKEEQHTKSEIGIVLCQAQEPRGQATHERERQPVETGECDHNAQRELALYRWNEPPATFEKRRSEHMGCIERVSSEDVKEQEPEAQCRRATCSGHDPFLIQLDRFRHLALWPS